MIPAIGLMIGAYIIVRMIEILQNKNNSTVLAVFAALTILICLVSIYVLIDYSNGGALNNLVYPNQN